MRLIRTSLLDDVPAPPDLIVAVNPSARMPGMLAKRGTARCPRLRACDGGGIRPWRRRPRREVRNPALTQAPEKLTPERLAARWSLGPGQGDAVRAAVSAVHESRLVGGVAPICKGPRAHAGRPRVLIVIRHSSFVIRHSRASRRSCSAASSATSPLRAAPSRSPFSTSTSWCVVKLMRWSVMRLCGKL